MSTSSISRSRTSITRSTKTKSPQTRDGICERFHKTVLNEFYRIAFRKKVYRSKSTSCRSISICGLRESNEARPHQGRWCLWQNPNADVP